MLDAQALPLKVQAVTKLTFGNFLALWALFLDLLQVPRTFHNPSFGALVLSAVHVICNYSIVVPLRKYKLFEDFIPAVFRSASFCLDSFYQQLLVFSDTTSAYIVFWMTVVAVLVALALYGVLFAARADPRRNTKYLRQVPKHEDLVTLFTDTFYLLFISNLLQWLACSDNGVKHLLLI